MALSYLQNQGDTHSATLKCGGSSHFLPLQGQSCLPAPPVHSGPHECSGGLTQSAFAGSRVGVDLMPSSLSGAPSSLAGDNRSFHDGSEPSASRLLFANVGLQSAGTDAIIQSWDGLQTYAFPLFGLLHRVLAKVRQLRGLELILVAPFWPQHPWFPYLLDLLVEGPFFLPQWKDLLKQTHFHRFHQNLPVLCLTAYRISSYQQEVSTFHWQWLVNLPAADGLSPE